MLTLHLIGLLVISLVFFYYNFSAIVWFVSVTLLTVIAFYTEQYSLLTCLLFYGAFVGVGTILCIKPIRRQLLTNNFINFFKKQLPQISITEAQAIEAGDVWWEGDIFTGKLNWQNIEDYPLHALSPAEQSFLTHEVEELCKLLNDWEITVKHKDLPPIVWEFLTKNKFFAINISKEFGGLGFSATAQSAIVTKVATKSITAAVTIMVPNALGPGELLQHYGTEQQKNYYLPRLASAEEIPCFALTSVYGGSDAGGMLDYGVICKQSYKGQETLGIKLSFAKRYITLAPVATLMGVAFKLSDPEKLYSNSLDLGITVALIPTEYPGIIIGKRHLAMLTPFQNGPIEAKDVFIPLDFIVGGAQNVGKGWYMLMDCLSSGRGISLPALSTATTQASYLSTSAYVSLRKQFKVPIAALEGIQEHLAKLSGLNYIANAVRLVTCSAIDQGLKPAVVSGIAKYHMTEMARVCINSAMDVHAGKGVMNGPNNYLIPYYMANPVAITVEGANILTRNLIIFGQGAFRAHPYILQELEALKEPDTQLALERFDQVLFKHIKFVICNVAKLIIFGLQRIYYPILRKRSWLQAYKKDITRLSTGLALTTDIALLVIGGKLKFKERMSARLGDGLSHIYMSMCIIKYYRHLTESLENVASSNDDNQINKQCIHDVILHTKWSLEYNLYHTQEALLAFIKNFAVSFPTKILASLLKFLIFPWGASYKKSSDCLEQNLATSSLSPQLFFNKMTELCAKDNALGNIYATFQEQYQLKPLLNKLDKFIKSKQLKQSNDLKAVLDEAINKGLINQSEFTQLHNHALNIDKILNVDVFDDLMEQFKNPQRSIDEMKISTE